MRGLPHESTRTNPALSQHAGDTEQPHALLAEMEAAGELNGHEEQPGVADTSRGFSREQRNEEWLGRLVQLVQLAKFKNVLHVLHDLRRYTAVLCSPFTATTDLRVRDQMFVGRSI
jgi:hypothetical protein